MRIERGFPVQRFTIRHTKNIVLIRGEIISLVSKYEELEAQV